MLHVLADRRGLGKEFHVLHEPIQLVFQVVATPLTSRSNHILNVLADGRGVYTRARERKLMCFMSQSRECSRGLEPP
jgi:hypothetical protein